MGVANLWDLAQQCRDDSERWFGDTNHDDTHHHALALYGEVGEILEAALDLAIATGKIANTVKKLDRGTFKIEDADLLYKVKDEMDDVFVYLLNMAGIFNYDLLEGYHRKRAINDARFMLERAKRAKVRSEHLDRIDLGET